MKKSTFLCFLFCLLPFALIGQWTTPSSNEVETTDQIIGPVLRISNEIRIPNTFATDDPSIGTLDNTGYGINIHKTNGIGFTFNNAHNFVFQPDGHIVAKGSNPVLYLRGAGTGNYQGAALQLFAEGVTPGNYHQSTLFITHRGTDGTASIEMQRRGSANEYNGTPFLYRDGYGWRLQVANNTTSGMSSGLIIKQTGNVGMGTDSPQTKLHVTTNTSGDAILLLEADTDNNNEADNPMIQLRQDGGQVGVNMGFANSEFGHNIFGIGARYTNQDNWQAFVINTQNGKVGIGTSNPGSWKLAVKGKIRAEEIKVETGWADYVFKDDYKLPSLAEVEAYIKEHGRLINMPSAAEVAANGIELGEMNKLLLEKIEELTLYVLELKHELNQLKR